MEMFEVGGCVRDEILGIPSKDIDFTVVLEGNEGPFFGADPFRKMTYELERMGFEIFVSSPEFLTIRARFPKGKDEIVTMRFASTYAMADGTTASWVPTPPRTMDISRYKGMTADFVLARKEAGYSDGRRPDVVIPGTLEDDLARRDFTMNAIAKAADGTLIDPFDGQGDIERRVIRAVGDAHQRIIVEDALRGMRALRFSVQKSFRISQEVGDVLLSDDFKQALRNISTERVRDELEKMFKASTVGSLFLIQQFDLEHTLFNSTGLRLMPTMKG
jgi:tRNA nucleotidyltransferase/poly(A) polymerase